MRRGWISLQLGAGAATHQEAKWTKVGLEYAEHNVRTYLQQAP